MVELVVGVVHIASCQGWAGVVGVVCGCSFVGDADHSWAPVHRLRLGLLGGVHSGVHIEWGGGHWSWMGVICSQAVLVVWVPGCCSWSRSLFT
jgi:hypothetical protein